MLMKTGEIAIISVRLVFAILVDNIFHMTPDSATNSKKNNAFLLHQYFFASFHKIKYEMSVMFE